MATVLPAPPSGGASLAAEESNSAMQAASAPLPAGDQLVVLETLSASWAHAQASDAAAVVKIVLKGPDVFCKPFMQGVVYKAVHKATKRAVVLIHVSAVPPLRQHVELQLQVAVLEDRLHGGGRDGLAHPHAQRRRDRRHAGSREGASEGTTEAEDTAADGESGLEGASPAEGSSQEDGGSGWEGARATHGQGQHQPSRFGAQSSHRVVQQGAGQSGATAGSGAAAAASDDEGSGAGLGVEQGSAGREFGAAGAGPKPLPEAIPAAAVAGDQYGHISAVDMSDPKRCLAVFKAIMKHNRDTKKEQQRQARLREARWQLQQARAMTAPPPDPSPSPSPQPQPTASNGNGNSSSSSSSSKPPSNISSGAGTGAGQPPVSVLVSVDLEWYEGDQSKLLEIGWSTWDSVTRNVVSKHWIVEENLAVRNGKYVPDHKHCFRFGQSVLGSRREGARALEADLQPETWARELGLAQEGAGQGTSGTDKATGAGAHVQENGEAETNGEQKGQLDAAAGGTGEVRVGGSSGGGRGAAGAAAVPVLPRIALVGHGMAGDLKLMQEMGVALVPGTQLIDTNNLAWALVGGAQVQYSLRSLLSWLEVPDVNKLHNAGNDARYTLEALLCMCPH